MSVVGLDMRAIEPGFKSHAGRGTGRYVRELVNSLEEIFPVDGLDFERLSGSEFELNNFHKKVRNSLPAGKMTYQTQFALPKITSKLPVDFVHYFSHGDAPAFGQGPHTLTVLDLIPLRFPELYSAQGGGLRFRFARWLENLAIKRASGIIAISEATKRDLIDLLGVEEQKIAVTPLSVAREFSTYSEDLEDRENAKGCFGLSPGSLVISYLGGIDPRKNIGFLIELLASLNEGSSEKEVLLLLGGAYANDDQYPVIKSKIESLGLSSKVIEVGFVADDKLTSFYRASDIFVFPSLYEGFGFPVLEAMASGVPVIAGNNSSMPELSDRTINGERGVILVEDNNLEAWQREVSGLLDTPDSKDSIGAAGQKRAEQFSWNRTAELTIGAWKEFGNEFLSPN